MIEVTVIKLTNKLRTVRLEADHDGARIDFGTMNDEEVKALINDLAGAIMELCE